MFKQVITATALASLIGCAGTATTNPARTYWDSDYGISDAGSPYISVASQDETIDATMYFDPSQNCELQLSLWLFSWDREKVYEPIEDGRLELQVKVGDYSRWRADKAGVYREVEWNPAEGMWFTSANVYTFFNDSSAEFVGELLNSDDMYVRWRAPGNEDFFKTIPFTITGADAALYAPLADCEKRRRELARRDAVWDDQPETQGVW